VFLEYNSFELRPQRGVDLPALKRTPEGFIQVDREMRTNLPGVFAAGDITGTIAAASKAMSEGVVAGLGAYAHVFARKFGREPSLFAYRATDTAITPAHREIPPFAARMPVVLLSTPRDVAKAWGKVPEADGVDCDAFLASADDRPSLTALARRLGPPLAETRALVTALAERKLATVHA